MGTVREKGKMLALCEGRVNSHRDEDDMDIQATGIETSDPVACIDEGRP